MTYANEALLNQLIAAQTAVDDIRRNLVYGLQALAPWPTNVIRAFTWNISESMVMLSLEKNLGAIQATTGTASVNSDSVPNQALYIAHRLYGYGESVGRAATGVLGYLFRTVEALDLAIDRGDRDGINGISANVLILLGDNGTADVDRLAGQLDQLRDLKYHAPKPTQNPFEREHVATNQDVLNAIAVLSKHIAEIGDDISRMNDDIVALKK